MRPKLLDLFCGGGGCGMGYFRAGFDVTGVDINPMPRYPFTFHQADALAFLAEHGAEYDVIHASPPCQAYSVTQSIHGNEYWDSIPPTRTALMASGKPWVMENVIGSPMINPIELCGTSFGLKVYRHRLFESNVFLWGNPCRGHQQRAVQVGRPATEDDFMTVAGHFSSLAVARKAMGIDWMTRDELAQAIPPAYTEYVGRQLLSALDYRQQQQDTPAKPL